MWVFSTPPKSGDEFTVYLISGQQVVIAYCPQLGWIDSEWNQYNEDSISCYKK